MKAIWNNKIIAESDDTVVLEGNHYFPEDCLIKEYFSDSNTTTNCSWKGEASYYNVELEGQTNKDAAWYYSAPSELANQINGRVAFWKGVEIRE